MFVVYDADDVNTKRKARVSNLSNNASPTTSGVKNLSDSWRKLLERMSSFTRPEMN